MFDLEPAIAEWRKQMLAVGIKTPVPLEELENHLREEIERQMKSGLSEQKAFGLAVQEIGKANMLKDEFEKVQASKETRQWKYFEIFFWVNIFLIPLLVIGQAFFFKNGVFSEMTTSQQMAMLTAAVIFSLLAWVMRLWHGKFPVLRTNRIRDAIFVPVLLWVIGCIIILPRCDFTDAQRALVSMWAFAPFGFLLGWCWGFVTAARKQVAQTGA